MHRLLIVALLFVSLTGQQKRFPYRAGTTAAVPSFTLTTMGAAPAETAAYRTKGTCWINVHNVKQCALTDQTTIPPGTAAYSSGTTYTAGLSHVTHDDKVWMAAQTGTLGTPSAGNAQWYGDFWAHGYTSPIPINSDNTWALLAFGGPDGQNFLFKLGAVTDTTIDVQGPFALPTGSEAQGIFRTYWDPHDPKVAYNVAFKKLWKLQCATPCNVAADWSWQLVKDFTSALSSVWSLSVFDNLITPSAVGSCAAGSRCPQELTYLFLYGVSDNGCETVSSIRFGSKREFAGVFYNRCTDTVAIRHSDIPVNDGATTTHVSPAFPNPGADIFYNNGTSCNNAFTVCYVQHSASVALLNMYAKPTSGIATVGSVGSPANSLSGLINMGHGATLWQGISDIYNTPSYLGCQNASACPPPEYEGYTTAFRVFPDMAATQVSGVTPNKFIFMVKAYWRQLGFHVGGSTWQNRSRWLVGLFYTEEDTAPAAHLANARDEIWAFDTDAAGIPYPTDSNTPYASNGATRRLARHFTCARPSCGSHNMSYAVQGHPSVSFDGTRWLYETTNNPSSWQGGAQVILGFIPPDITSTYP